MINGENHTIGGRNKQDIEDSHKYLVKRLRKYYESKIFFEQTL